MRHDPGPAAPGVDLEQERVLRAELSRLIEPGDLLAGLALETFGAQSLHALITSARAPSAAERDRMAQVADSAGLGARQQDLRTGLARWRTRCGQLHGASDLATIRRLGGGLLIPQDPGWPAQLGDLGPLAPVAIWFRGSREESASQALGRLPGPARTVAIVGSREVTDYGIRITAQLTEDLVHAGLCVVSGGAYGVDAAAHRAALRACSDQDSGSRRAEDSGDRDASRFSDADRSAPTLAVLAGGLDRFYPAGNERLLREVAEQGLLLSEMAPGSAPTRHRFLQRNRLIAALGMVTVITEARWRSGAQSTAHHALNLGREVGVIPGSVFSAASAGCHRLLRETPAQLVRDATDILNLVAEGAGPETAHPPGPSQESLAIGSWAGRRESASRPAVQPELPLGREHPQDGLDEAQRLLFDALPRRGLSAPGKLSQVAGLPLPTVLAELTRLQRSGRARMVNGHWGRA
ncbi:hypothetical protein BG28_05260 [Nesterenkonia sp. AN1]|uniref:DNA processing protein n=1 Tax=Nesterenkonia aurantiaca TaxID=1436010 RepID=A0A4R7G3T6_9MICC|nr:MULTISPECIES: DNA-processing protein DprA [Nesterenkonia]EXF24431.1 hypothetical protein BG28_05260 [Nesterenkonia sp. AN1]TDS86054.1 DNA processing protein [Nesterenkonia aurantiaca]